MAGSKPHLHIEEAEVIYGGFFETPLVQFLTLESGVHVMLFEKLASFQPILENTGFSTSLHNLSQSYFELRLFGGFGLLRLWPNAIEIRLQNNAPSLKNLPPKDLSQTVDDLISRTALLLESVERRLSFASHSITLNLHGKLRGTTVLDFLQAYVKEPPAGLGDLAEVGARYVFSPDANRLGSWLVAEPSALVKPDGMFAALGVTFQGESTRASEVVASAQAYFQTLAQTSTSPLEVNYASG